MSQNTRPNYDQPIDPRSTASSNASTNRYVPESYGGPSPAAQAAPGDYFASSQPRGPSLGAQQVPSVPPVPNNVYGPGPGTPGVYVPGAGTPGFYGSSPGAQSYYGSSPGGPGYYGSSPGMQAPNGQLHPSAAAVIPQQPPYPQNSGERNGYIPAPSAPRRSSHSSVRSHRSHRSGRSHHSRQSRDSRRSSDGGDRRSHDNRRSRDSPEPKPLKRTKTLRPSWGDTIYGMFGVIKDALGPRDKY